MRDLILSAGHSDGKGSNPDRGTVALGRYEGDLTLELRDLIDIELKKLGIIAKKDKNQDALRETLAYFKSLVNGKTLAVDIHFNAFNGVATGCEVVIPDNPSSFERSMATELSDALAKTLLIKNRGVKEEKDTARKKLGWMRMPCENFIIEVCFMDNKQDILLYQANKNGLAIKVANVINKYIKD